MTNGLNGNQTKFLTYLVYVLLALLTFATGWHFRVLSSLPNEYVRLERYLCDNERLEKTLETIDGKLTRLIERR